MSNAKVLDGRRTAAELRAAIGVKVRDLQGECRRVPGLAVVLVGDDPASKVYVGQKEKACREAGIRSFLHHLPASTSTSTLTELLEDINKDPDVHGMLVQLPIPGHIDWTEAVRSIDVRKDVDGTHPLNLGRLVMGLDTVEPCTPRGVMYLLKKYGIDLSGKRAVVLGRSNIVGKPMAQLLLAADATVTVCHSKSIDIETMTREADIIIAAIGRPEFLKASMVKPGCVVVDVGISRLDGGLVGDVDFQDVSRVASWITPVPGGVGPMTIAMLLQNTLERYLELECA
ncbi:MAG TPA: bifunctional methylenetetrahydrofolate dehydrogenase/methenyltetrahydrofolate cyclohydrolase FolD [Synergistales bacterium]|jgi:methylenetetrahydrofolate dehydrogenase (NADP+)/methenyltetrahydrofolate cyclohydrolase|nr:bifunctional methylenetetrahydrofolate dehydrogenase/methenyltetrahydrofolate cyclohydrolase FolD [Synergistales bacterium]MDI9391837.1 bifunctional methylenetetrahydrofolate dehydrogenase/methenyltetrahydrofolate cyclohydrolase FolD [Synergistota bacterium]NLV64492.1 bifunctional methylenetetrahydrofolate dehydrogenase/methenyltetrahydrofolate cyclohydrolase FolD [Synergistaceae bacterium]MDD5514886.1 bifunctional methylenetetrahydrofolate dehydrogenase/methenyltetrahydrofolate cyclohydrolas